MVGGFSSIYEFEKQLKTIPLESISYHAKHNHFFNWVMALAEVSLAARMHKHHFAQIKDDRELRECSQGACAAKSKATGSGDPV